MGMQRNSKVERHINRYRNRFKINNLYHKLTRFRNCYRARQNKESIIPCLP